MEQTQSVINNQSISWVTERYRKLVLQSLEQISGVTLVIEDPQNTWLLGDDNAALQARLTIHDMQCYSVFIRGGSVGAAEAWMDQLWSTPDLTALIRVFARCQQQLDSIESNKSWLRNLASKLFALQTRNSQSGSKRNILAHYDLGNSLYERFLDPAMQYSSAIYPSADATLEQAQQHKLRTICERLQLQASDHLLEIGTGWGGLAIFAAKHYGCSVTTTTISDAQYAYAKTAIEAQGLGDKIILLNLDYRKLTGQYDKLVSIEMIEAVGHQYLPQFFEQCSQRLKPDGRMLLQAITISDQRYASYRTGIDFIRKYIFPGGCLPCLAEISKQFQRKTDMVIEQIDDIGLHYARTLNDWRNNFELNWCDIQQHGFDETFKRLWLYYFCYCEGAFLEQVISTHHVVARKPLWRSEQDETLYPG